jgi:hypothetical protein
VYPPPTDTEDGKKDEKKNGGASCCFRGRSIRIVGWWHGRCRFQKLTTIEFMENAR